MPELTRRYLVRALATEAPFDLADPDGAFVLRPWKDPAALHALRAYADRCYPELSEDLHVWIRAIERGAIVRGDVGRRNERHARGRATARRTARGPAGRTGTVAGKAARKGRRRRS